MRYDLAFFLCCCKSFLGPTENDGEFSDDDDDVSSYRKHNFYTLLGLQNDATFDEIKRAYKRKSLQMHPDKIAQRGKVVTTNDQAKFTRMKEAYEVLSDKHKRETYDAIGERGMKWLEEPFSLDPQELAHNFAKSSILDRSKIFGIFVVIAVAIFILPILVCLHVDNVFGPNANWMYILIPLWIWNLVILFYHTRVILMGPINRPEHIPVEEWVDPLPMSKRIFSLIRFLLIFLFEILVTFRLDGFLGLHKVSWSIIFFPLYIWEATTLYKKWPLARMKIVIVDDLEAALGKSFTEFTVAEKDIISKRYSVVPSTSCPEYDAAMKIKQRARQDIIKSFFRILFVILLIYQLDTPQKVNWWLIFIPFWIMTLLICYANYQQFADVQQMAMDKDPSLFVGVQQNNENDDGDVEYQKKKNETNYYGSVGKDGDATIAGTTSGNRKKKGKTTTQKLEAAATATTREQQHQEEYELTDEEREELKSRVLASGSRLFSKCCSQGFLLLIVFLFVGKIQGAHYSSLWIIFPLLFVAALILCCLSFAIFGITEVPTDGVEFDTASMEGDGFSGVSSMDNDITTTKSAGNDSNNMTTARAVAAASGESNDNTINNTATPQQGNSHSSNYTAPQPTQDLATTDQNKTHHQQQGSSRQQNKIATTTTTNPLTLSSSENISTSHPVVGKQQTTTPASLMPAPALPFDLLDDYHVVNCKKTKKNDNNNKDNYNYQNEKEPVEPIESQIHELD